MADPLERTLPPVPSDVPADWVADNLAELSEMNGETWETLQESGVEEGGTVRIEFAFTAPNEEEAGELADRLLIAGYEAQAAAAETEDDGWSVSGRTEEAAVTPAGLEEWLRRMIATGWQHGESTLDGWTALLD